jgi:excisionase family DNA binding protein
MKSNAAVQPPQFTLPPKYANRVTLTIAEVCAATPTARSTVYLAIQRGELRIAKLGRRTLVPVESWLAWLRGEPPASAA